MPENTDLSKKRFSPDWFLQGALTRLGDSLDKLTGRKWVPSSSLAASELIERIKKLLDTESIEVPGKGTVVPHHIQLKMQWNKFSEDAEGSLKDLEAELTAAAVDHINDSLYYTYAPVRLEIKPDYFIEGVKLYVDFDDLDQEKRDAELNVTVPAINLSGSDIPREVSSHQDEAYVAKFTIKDTTREKRLEFGAQSRCSVGRSGSNDLVLDDASVSKMHASLSIADDGSLVVADTGSTNGTFINDQRIAYGKATALVEGDKVRFGQVEVTLTKQTGPVVVGSDKTSTDEPANDAIVEIDGFEFKRRTSAESATPEQDAATEPDLSAPPIPGPDDSAASATEHKTDESKGSRKVEQ